MAEIKAHEFESQVGRIIRNHAIFLVYGPDRGLVSERAKAIAEKSNIPLDDPFCIVRMDATDLNGDPGRLMDEAQSMGLFGGEKLVWVKGTGTEKALLDGTQALLTSDLSGTLVIIEAGDLKKGTGLRKLVEASQSGLAIPCYADDDRAVNALIDQELSAAGLRISASARERLVDILGGDRLASRNEIRKLALYARGEDLIDDHHVIEIVGDASAISADDAVDAVLKGDVDDFIHAIQKVISSKISVFVVLQSCLRQFQLLDLMRTEIDKGQTLQQVMGTHGRGLHFRRKPIIEAALRNWSAQALAQEMNRIQSAILMTRQTNALEDSISIHTLLSTTLQSKKPR